MKTRCFTETWIACSLRTRFRQAIFAFSIALVVLPFGYRTTRIEAAAILSSFPNQTDIRRAIMLDPANPRFYGQMGRIYLTSLNVGPAKAIAWFRKAAALEPGSSFHWESLAQACELAGEESCAENSFSRALSAAPMEPRAFWLAANHGLLAGNTTLAAVYFRRLLALDPEYADAVFATASRAYGNLLFAGEQILPSRSSAALKLAYLNFLASQNDFSSARQWWSQLAFSHARFDFSLADPYLEKLIATGRIAQATEVWRDLEKLRILPGGDGGKSGNLVFNGDFERSPLNAGFDWRSRNVAGVDVQFADPSTHRGARCVRVDYVVSENLASEPVYELIPVLPLRTYRLSAWVRSQEIASNSGPRLRVLDPEHPRCPPSETQDAEGTTGWHEVSATFSTCSQTELVRLSVWRPPDADFPSDISGHFWLDDIALKPAN